MFFVISGFLSMFYDSVQELATRFADSYIWKHLSSVGQVSLYRHFKCLMFFKVVTFSLVICVTDMSVFVKYEDYFWVCTTQLYAPEYWTKTNYAAVIFTKLAWSYTNNDLEKNLLKFLILGFFIFVVSCVILIRCLQQYMNAYNIFLLSYAVW